MKRIMTLLFIFLLLFLTLNAAGTAPPAENDVKGILHKVSPSIVKVVAENHKRYIATGIAIAPNHIISSSMVIRYPYRELYIRTAAGEEFPAKLLGKDNGTSLILLEINKKALTPFKQAKGTEVGDWVALVGSFYRKFPSIFQGIVSSSSDEELILNAPVVPGSPGSAVVNKKGELLGVVRGRFGYASNPDYTYKDHSIEFFMRSSRAKNRDLCYAVPVARVVSVAKDLEKFGKVRKGWLGLLLRSRGEEDVPGVSSVTKNSPADKAGIRQGDRILKIKNKPVRSGSDVVQLVKTLKPGEKVKIELLRDNIKKSVIAIIGEAEKGYRWRYTVSPDGGVVVIPEVGESLPMMQNYVLSFSGSRTLGFDVVAITPELAEKFNVKERSGLMISKVYNNTAAKKAGFQPADIIVRAGGKEIKRNADLRQVLNELDENESTAIVIYRSGKRKTINVVPGKTRNQYFGIFDRFRNKMKDIQIRMDDENRLSVEKVRKLQEKYAKEAQLSRDTALKKYKLEIERMKKQQEALMKELERMRKLIEKEKKKQETNI